MFVRVLQVEIDLSVSPSFVTVLTRSADSLGALDVYVDYAW